MGSIPLSEGDLRWVFPDLADQDEVRTLLERADEQLRRLAALCDVQAGWASPGLGYDRSEGPTDLMSYVDPPDVSFLAELTSPPPLEWIEWDSRDYGPPWEVVASVSVRCAATHDCGMHAIEEFDPSEKAHMTPVAAARDLVAATAWLLKRAQAVPLSSWRQRDPGCRGNVIKAAH